MKKLGFSVVLPEWGLVGCARTLDVWHVILGLNIQPVGVTEPGAQFLHFCADNCTCFLSVYSEWKMFVSSAW
jgi:hypothetical protein